MVYRVISPFGALRELQQALDSTHRSDWFGSSTTGPGAFPAVNVFSKGDDCVIIAELPGVDKSSIDISVKGNQVTIKGNKDVQLDEDASVHRRERTSGHFDRTLTMPIEVETDKVQADYQNGMLAVYLPRAEADKPRSVTIN